MKWRVGIGLVFFLAWLLVFYPAFSLFFFLDDGVWLLLGKAFVASPSAATLLRPDPVTWYWRPANILFFGALYGLFGLQPLPYYGVHLLLHLLNGFLVFLLARTLGLSRLGGSIAGVSFLIFACHHQAAVRVSMFHDVGLTTCVLLLVILLLRSGGRLALRAAALGLFLLALGFKEAVVTLPIVLLFLPGEASWGQRCKLVAPFLVASLLYGLFYFTVLSDRLAAIGEEPGRGEFHLGAHAAYHLFLLAGEGLLHLFGLSSNQALPVVAARLGFALLLSAFSGLTLLAGVLLVIWAVRGRPFRPGDGRLTLFAGVWFLSFLFPVSFLDKIANPEAYFLARYRYAYLPSVGLSLLFALVCQRLSEQGRQRGARGLLILYLSLLFSYHALSQRTMIEGYRRLGEQTRFALHLVEEASPKEGETLLLVGFGPEGLILHGEHMNYFLRVFFPQAPRIEWRDRLPPKDSPDAKKRAIVRREGAYVLRTPGQPPKRLWPGQASGQEPPAPD